MLFLLFAMAYLIGVGVGTFGVSLTIYLSVGLILSAIVFSIFLSKKITGTVVIAVLILTLGWKIGSYSYDKNLENWKYIHSVTNGYTRNVAVIGLIDDLAYMSDFTSTYRLKIANIDTISTNKDLNIFVEIPKNITIHLNDVIGFTGKILPILSPTLTGFERYAWKDGVVGKVSIYSFETIEKGSVSYFEKMQEWSKKTIFEGFPRNSAAIILGTTIGNTDLLSRGLRENFMQAGLTHILVVSGSNIAFVILFTFFFLKYFIFSPRIRAGVVTLFVLLYGTLVGWDAPVIRATCMGVFTYIALQFHSKTSSISLLFFISLIYVSYFPNSLLYDAGFGLSFCATAGILLFGTKIQSYLYSLGLYQYLSDILAITLSAMIGSIPIMIFHFGTFAINGILSNILIAPILGPLLFLSVGYLSLVLFGINNLYLAGLIVYFPTKYILYITSFFAGGYQIVIPEYLRSAISLFLIGILGIILLYEEYHAIVMKNQTKPMRQ